MLDQIWAILGRSFTEICMAARHVELMSRLHNPHFVIDGHAAAPKSATADDAPLRVQNGIAIIGVEGPLSKRLGWFEQRYLGMNRSMVSMAREIQQAAADPNICGTLLFVDSPGGTVAGTSDLADAVYAHRQAKPVIAYASDMMASAAYYVGSQADKIYTDRDALVGSIGTYMVVPDYSRMAEAEGIKFHVVKAGKNKGAGVPGTVVTDDQLADFQREVDGLNEVFTETVARGRGWSADKTDELATGQVWVGREAASVGLSDGIKTLDETLAELAGMATGRRQAQRPRFVVIETPPV